LENWVVANSLWYEGVEGIRDCQGGSGGKKPTKRTCAYREISWYRTEHRDVSCRLRAAIKEFSKQRGGSENRGSPKVKLIQNGQERLVILEGLVVMRGWFHLLRKRGRKWDKGDTEYWGGLDARRKSTVKIPGTVDKE